MHHLHQLHLEASPSVVEQVAGAVLAQNDHNAQDRTGTGERRQGVMSIHSVKQELPAHTSSCTVVPKPAWSSTVCTPNVSQLEQVLQKALQHN